MPRRSGDWWLVTSHSQLRIPDPCFQTFSGGFAAPKRKPTPPRCARQPLPREGAHVDTTSFLGKEVPRRGGGWMGIAVFPKHSLPRVGKVASGASRIGFYRYEKERGEIVSSASFTRAPERRPKRKPTPPRCARQPLPREGACVDTPSFLWKEVPRRGGGWMGKAG